MDCADYNSTPDLQVGNKRKRNDINANSSLFVSQSVLDELHVHIIIHRI